jgi:cytochrome c5
MKKHNLYKATVHVVIAVATAAGLIGLLEANRVYAGPPPAPPAQTNAVANAAPAKHKITGAELYSIHCNRCHPERYPTERTAAQWKTIMLHMQVRANLPAKQSRLILQYLQDNSGR